ncbi:MAG: AAA family ATPase [Firmicutes bacterium]|nr:AAA family ATPase [Alicyclobacillaceae bacterium]MCL6496884.1 AAA family ATPase [Bacillota bacterium]
MSGPRPGDRRDGPSQRPASAREVLFWVEEGRLQPVEALTHLRRMQAVHPAVGPGPRPSNPSADQAMDELERLVGLEPVKAVVRELRAFVEIQRRRQEVGLKTDLHTLHMVFSGSPGTGKTTVARILARLLQGLGVLPRGHLVEAERADLVGEYIGHTAQKTRELIRRALGGVLFIDEAYSLARGGDKDFGREAIDALVKAMEDYRDQFVLVLAGYPTEMEWFLATNPGLGSRVALHLVFPDYSPAELVAIARQMVRDRQYLLTREAEAELARYLERRGEQSRGWAGNGRFVRNLVERAIRRQAVRLAQHGGPYSREQLMTLTWSDLDPEGGGEWRRYSWGVPT